MNLLAATLWVGSTSLASAASSETTKMGALEPETCIPGAQLYYAKDYDEEDAIKAEILHGKARKPDATVVRYDAPTETVYIKRSGGSNDKIKLFELETEHWFVVYQAADSSKGAAVNKAPASSWQTSWDGFLSFAEQELNRLPPNAPGPWDGKEVTWEGTVSDMEVMTARNLIRLVFDMPARTLTIKGQEVGAGSLMMFVPMQYENLGAVQKGATVRFKTIIAPIDAKHAAVSAQPGKQGGKAFLLIFTKGGTILK